jgi:protein-S-isoprenylcysteine O-methyltransferase Ste14
LILIVVGLALVVCGQIDLGESWRIGIDQAARPGLVVDGLYRISRNPIFLGMFVSLVGFLLLMTTVLSLFVLIGSMLVVRYQVRREEMYLLEAYGIAYRSYAQRVGRFLPWMGRLR